ncbi:MAG TPA: aspartate--tRNA ligase [Bryobacteraceae bacterium]|nr:aspartate--tRNA ligase [Bryobacteraceae bacterium]
MQSGEKHQYRTHTCGELRAANTGSEVRLSGWLRNRRDHGGVYFIDLADHYGVTQLVIEPGAPSYDLLSSLPKESVVRVDGKVVAREEGAVNPAMATGEIEVRVSDADLLGSTEPVPFSVFPETAVPEDMRLTYRFLDLRKSKMHANILLRSRIIASIRRRMVDLGFVEYQTPTLTASSPEGARDFLVPSRRHPGKFYALPQAPQMFKQLIMVSGFDRYFQIAPCYRDEDSRADRSPGEFYQLDLEMSFVTQDDVFKAVEALLTGLFAEFRPDRQMTSAPFPRITYADAMLKYGSDKPDLRNPLEIKDLSALFKDTTFRAFSGKTIRAINIPAGAEKSRSFFDKLEEQAKSGGAAGLAWLTVEAGGSLKGPIAKFLTPENVEQLKSECAAKVGDAIIILADTDVAKMCKILSGLRDGLGRQLGLIEENIYKCCWIVDFPMYELDDNGKVAFSHNPFSMPQGGLDALNNMDPLTIKAFQYDIVCNGYELSSGAIRNHRPEIMYRAFEIAGYGKDEVNSRFRALINALKFGAPPHGGIAPGVDRIVMLLADEPNIREVIMFPMNQNAEDMMMNAPNTVRPEQLRELHIRIVEPPAKKAADKA